MCLSVKKKYIYIKSFLLAIVIFIICKVNICFFSVSATINKGLSNAVRLLLSIYDRAKNQGH